MINGETETIQISSSQLDELNSLEAIYGSQFFQIEEQLSPKIVNVVLEKSDSINITLTLKFQLPDDYPEKSPPLLEINCPYMNRSTKNRLYDRLQEIYVENLGEPILYLWIEESRTFLDNFESSSSKNDNSYGSEESNLEVLSLNETFDSSIGGDFPMLEIPEILSGSTITDRKSVFQAHLAKPLFCKEQVPLILAKLKENSKICRATHNIYAYRICSQNSPKSQISVQDCEDDGETQAGQRLLHLLTLMKAENVLVVVSRWYGGIHLGADRFKHINNVARILLEENGFGGKKLGKK